MIKIDKIETFGWGAAIRGMRNPLNSWDKSDSEIFVADFGENVCYRYGARENFKSNDPDIDRNSRYITHVDGIGVGFSIGENDIKLMRSLIRGGPVEAKFRRMIHIQMDILAPLYWWKEFDTYKVGTVANSCSTMHKIHAKEFTLADFSRGHLYDFTPDAPDGCTPLDALKTTIDMLNYCRKRYLITQNKEDWWQMIQLLPTSYNQLRTVDLSYEVLANIYKHRKNHKLDEWKAFCAVMVSELPYSWIFTEEWDWEDVPKKNSAAETKTEEKNEKPTSGRFPRRNDAPDAMVYAIPYVEWVKKKKDHKNGTKSEPKEADKDEVFALALIEAVGTLRERGYNNQEIRDMLIAIFGEV